MKKIMIPVILTGMLAVSCSKKENTVENNTTTPAADTTAVATPQDTTKVATGDTTQVSVDWNGTYKGKIPCADCPGIETVLTLNNDKTYTLESNYLESKEGKFTDKGTFEWSKDGSYITLKDAKDPTEEKVFFVGEGAVWMVEKVGDQNRKDEYKLTK